MQTQQQVQTQRLHLLISHQFIASEMRKDGLDSRPNVHQVIDEEKL
jgi:hypothetical protein